MARAGSEKWWLEAKSNLETARILKNRKKFNEAYFHAGQSIEFLLKAIFLKRENLHSMPDEYKGARWHDLKLCFEAARVQANFNQPHTSRALKANWLTVRDWRSNARFPDAKAPRRELDDLIAAVCDDVDGVWTWLDAIYQKL